MKQFVMLMLWAGLAVALTGCVADAPPEAATGEVAVTVEEPAASAPTVVESAAEATSALAALAPTATSEAIAPAEPTATTAPADWSTVATLEGDYVILGNPAAPIRLVDYSDFM